MTPDPVANRVLSSMPEFSGLHYLYREASWISWLLRFVLLLLATGLMYLVMATIVVAPGSVSLVLVGLFGAMLCFLLAYIVPVGDNSVLFACSPEGLFFPEKRLFKAAPSSWLLVPWRNVLDYRVQLLLDETSSRGIVMALTANEVQQKTYFSRHLMYGQPSENRADYQAGQRVIFVGYATFLPRPDQVLAQMQAVGSARYVQHSMLKLNAESDQASATNTRGEYPRSIVPAVVR